MLPWAKVNPNLYVLDRHEDNGLSVLESEDGLQIIIPTSWLPEGTREGNVLQVGTALDTGELEPASGLNAVYFELDETATRARRERLTLLRSSLLRGPEGDIKL